MIIHIEEVDIDKNYYQKLNFVSKQVFDFKFYFVFQRLFVLDDEIRREEERNPAACIKLIMEGDTVNDFMKIRGYSKELSAKINACFIDEAIYFQNKLHDIASISLN